MCVSAAIEHADYFAKAAACYNAPVEKYFLLSSITISEVKADSSHADKFTVFVRTASTFSLFLVRQSTMSHFCICTFVPLSRDNSLIIC